MSGLACITKGQIQLKFLRNALEKVSLHFILGLSDLLLIRLVIILLGLELVDHAVSV